MGCFWQLIIRAVGGRPDTLNTLNQTSGCSLRLRGELQGIRWVVILLHFLFCTLWRSMLAILLNAQPLINGAVMTAQSLFQSHKDIANITKHNNAHKLTSVRVRTHLLIKHGVLKEKRPTEWLTNQQIKRSGQSVWWGRLGCQSHSVLLGFVGLTVAEHFIMRDENSELC